MFPILFTDFGVPTLDQMEEFIQHAKKVREAGKPIVVHCHAGYGRTGIFIACYLVAVRFI